MGSDRDREFQGAKGRRAANNPGQLAADAKGWAGHLRPGDIGSSVLGVEARHDLADLLDRLASEVQRLSAERDEAKAEVERLRGRIRRFLDAFRLGGGRPSDLRDDLLNSAIDDLAGELSTTTTEDQSR